MTAEVVIICVNFHGHQDVRTLVDSLASSSSSAWRLVVVDNSEDDDEYQRLVEMASDRIGVVRADRNLGYFGGARLALAETATGRAAWMVVCNADLTFHRDFVGRLSTNAPTRMLAPAILSGHNGRDQNPFLESRPSTTTLRRWRWQFRWTPVARLSIALDSLLSRRRKATKPVSRDIYAPHGSCLVFPQLFFERGGSLEHPVFLFGEEVTVAERCRELGISISYDPELRVQHASHSATGVWRTNQTIAWQRESIEYIDRILASRISRNR